jgi:DNA-binding NarL/FixJ family response regulator
MTDSGPGVSVLIVDDHEAARRAMRMMVRVAPGFDLAGEAATGEEAVSLAGELHPDLVLMDINLPGINGITATRTIIDRMPDTVVFLCSTYRHDDLPADAATSGAAAYVHKEELGARLLRELWSERPGIARR